MNANGSLTIYIRARICRAGCKAENRYIPLCRLLPEQVTKTGKIKDHHAEMMIQKELVRCNDLLIEQGLNIESWSADRVANFLRTKGDGDVFTLDFFEFCDREVAILNDSGRNGTAVTYKQAVRSFREFCGGAMDVNNITTNTVQAYIDNLAKDRSENTIKSYVSGLRSLYNICKKKHNDEDFGVKNVKRDPFANVKMPKVKDAMPVELDAEALRIMYGLDGLSRYGSMARDAFMMSFMCCGMNLADMYELEGVGDTIEYWRKKTRDRSPNASHMILDVVEEMKPVMKRLTPHGRWMFGKFGSMSSLHTCVNKGLKEVKEAVVRTYAEDKEISTKQAEKELGMDTFTFYAARDSWAGIALNRCGIGVNVIDRCLCHSGKTLAESAYIKRDMDIINDANRKVMNYVFGERKDG